MPIAYDEESRTLIRSVYADSDDVIPEVLQEAGRSDAWSDGPEIQVPDQPLLPFDMGCTGTAVTPHDSFQVRIPSGCYLVGMMGGGKAQVFPEERPWRSR
ncbi:hypothetical protein [Streptomyces adustus]